MNEVSQESSQGGVIQALRNSPQFARESWIELKKVSRPTRAETMQATVAVLVMILIVSVYLALADLVFKTLMDAILA